MLAPMMTTNDLHTFFERGWNRHDVDLLMTFMAEDCVYESTAGPEACGTRHAGREPVRGVRAGARGVPGRAVRGGAPPRRGRPRALGVWRFTGTTAEGKAVEVDGCDLFTFAGDKITRKSAYFKSRTP